MNRRALDEAIFEAERFLKRAAVVTEAHDRYLELEVLNPAERGFYSYYDNPLHGGKDSASVRRASMDLTRSLADLRRS